MQNEKRNPRQEKREYGVWGLMELKAVIPVGKGRLNIHFTGGCITEYGIVPATFATSDPVVIHLLEQSEYYRSGRVKRIRNGLV